VFGILVLFAYGQRRTMRFLGLGVVGKRVEYIER
jgi:hypothetical protein